MKRIKKAMALALTILMLTLGACSNSTQPTNPSPTNAASAVNPRSTAGIPSEPTEIRFMHIHGGAGGELVNTFCEEFTELSGGKYKIKPLYVEGSYEGVIERLLMLSLNDDFPEISQAGHQYAYFMAENMPIIPLQEFIDKEGYNVSDLFPKMLDLGRDPSGRIVGLPFAVSTPVLFYNKDMFEANGIKEAPRTFDELRETAKRLTKDGNYGIYINYEITGNWEIQCLIENYGEQMLSANRKSVGFNNAGLKTFELINNLVNVDQSMPITDSSESATQAQELFKAGRIGMYISTIASLRGFQRDAQFTVATALHPSVDGKPHGAPAGGNSVYILTNDPQKQEGAWEFIKYINAPEQSNRVAQVFGYMVTSQSALTTPALMGDYLIENPAAKVTYDQVNFMTPWCNFPGNAGTKYVKITQDNFNAMIHKEKNPTQAFNDTVSQLNELIAHN